MHWTYPLPLRLEGAHNVYTVHDAIPLDAPGLSGISPRRHRRLLEQISAVADLVITVSEHSRASLTRWLPHLSRPVANTYQSVLTPPPADVRLPPGLEPGRYLLACGRVEPRKNLRRLVMAHRASEAALPLVIVGPDGWRATAELPTEMLGPAILRLPWVERPVLVELMRRARALVFPSLAEGFGLPALEAMALGTPLIAASSGGLVEVASGAALFVEPLDISALARAISRVSTDDDLCRSLAAAGLSRARDFDAEIYAGRLADAYGALT